MKKEFILFILIAYSIGIFAQNPYPKEASAKIFLNRKLIVQITDGNSETSKIQNNAIKEIFTDNWKLTEFDFLTESEINEIKKEKDENYSFLTFNNALLKDVREGYISKTGFHKHGIAPDGSIPFNYTAFTFSFFNYNLEQFENGKLKTITQIGFANGELFKTDYLYLCQQITNLIKSASQGIKSSEFYNPEKNIDILENSTLVFDKSLFKEKELKKISNYYAYNFEIVDSETLENIILEKKENTCYVKIIWSNQHNIYVWVTVDASDGSIRSIMSFGGVQFGKHHKANEIIKVKHFKYITKLGAQKMNSRY